jgi:hypothetical protein
VVLASACSGDDSDNPASAGTSAKGGSGAKAGSGGSGAKAGKGGTGNEGGGDESGGTGGTGKGGTGGTGKGGTGGTGKGGTGGTGNSGNEGGTGEGATGNVGGDDTMAGMGGMPVEPDVCDIYAAREIADIPADVDGNVDFGGEDNLTLTSDKTWRINGRVYVGDGKTLNIDPCTLIIGTRKPNAGSLFIGRGGKINAVGTKDKPIVFSSDDFEFHPSAPWGGVVLLGKSVVGPNVGTALGAQEKLFEGMTDVRATFGGDDVHDSSGTMSYVRIEYGGDIIAADKEVNGLTFGGVGDGTTINHIMVKRQMDDCFEFFGGTVNVDHLICQDTGDDMFDTDLDFRGHLQFLFGRLLTYGTSSDPNGFEWDGNQDNQNGTEEAGAPQAANATVCGLGVKAPAVGYGAVLRRRLQPGTSLINTIVTGFDAGADTRDAVGTTTPMEPVISWTQSLFFGNFGVLPTVVPANPPGFDNFGVPGETDNDAAFDEVAWLTDPSFNNNNGDDYATLLGVAPEGFDCYSTPPSPPSNKIPGAAPGDGFDTSADFIGAVEDADHNWMTGRWVNWD